MGHPGEVAATSPELLTQEQGSGQCQIPVVQSRWMQTEVVFCACSCIRNGFDICTNLCAMEIKVDICVHSARFLAGFGCSEGPLETLNAAVAYECQVHQTGTGDFCSTSTREHLGPQVRKTRENQLASWHMMSTLWWQGVSRMHETASNSKKSRLPWHWPMKRERERWRKKQIRKKKKKKKEMLSSMQMSLQVHQELDPLAHLWKGRVPLTHVMIHDDVRWSLHGLENFGGPCKTHPDSIQGYPG